MVNERTRRLVLVIAAIAVGINISACNIYESVEKLVLTFRAPRIYLHMYENPADVASKLTFDSSEMQLDREPGHLSITGTGIAKWGEMEMVVSDNGITIDGVFVESRPDSYRNVTISKEGEVLLDRWIPFEAIVHNRRVEEKTAARRSDCTLPRA